MVDDTDSAMLSHDGMEIAVDFFETMYMPEWAAHAIIIVLLTILARFIVGRSLQFFSKKAFKTDNFWDDALIQAGQKPLYLLIWLLGLSRAAGVIWQHLDGRKLEELIILRELLVLGLLFWASLAFVKAIETHYTAMGNHHKTMAMGIHHKMDQTYIIAIGRLVRIVMLIVGILLLLQKFGYSLSGLLAFGGVGGIAVGFASKDMLANFFGGWMIYLDKPFRVGDWICSPDKDIEGTVDYIGWRQTRILTFSRRPLYVPNSTFANITVENPSRMQNRRIKQIVGLRYCDSDKVDAVLRDIRVYLQEHEQIDQDKAPIVNFISFGSSSLDCQIYCFTKTTVWAEYLMIQEAILLQVVQIIHQHNADIAFPTTTLDVPVHEADIPVEAPVSTPAS